MRQLSHPFALSACSLAAALLVSACGGGGASPPPGIPGSSGFAVDGYLDNATVLCDSNGNGVSDAGEVATSTDPSGFFKFSVACTATVVVTGGTSIDTQLPFTGQLKAPAGSTIVTPLTTLLAGGMTIDQVNAALGLPAGTDLKTLDPARRIDGALVNPDLFRKTLVVQQLVQKTSEMLAGLASSGGAAALPAIYSEVAASVATLLRTNTVLISGNTLDQTVIAALVASAVQKVATSPTLSPEVKSGAMALNSGSVGEVIAGSLKAQAEAILSAADSNVVNTTKAVQMDTQITAFIQTNKAALAAAPSGATASLATTLTTAVTSAITGGGGTTTPPPTGTVLVSFDEATPVFIDMGAYGGAAPTVGAGPSGGSGNALRILKPSGQEAWGGVYFGVPSIAFSSTRKSITARVNATRAGAVIKFKVESGNGGPAIEVASTPTGAANTWQTVTWDMTGVDISKSYTIIAITPDQELTASGQSYYIDDITLAPAAAAAPLSCATSTSQCISFSESTIALLGFEGLVSATVVDDPVAGASNKVAKFVKGPTGQLWAGATLYTAGTVDPTPGVHSVLTIDTVGLNTSKIVTVRSYSGAAVGTKMTLKLENGIEAGQNIAAETVTTKQNEWETLTFNFANTSTGVFSPTVTYNTASIFPAFSIPGTNTALATDTTFYFDELTYAVATAPTPTPTPTPTATTLATFDESTAPTFVGFDGGEGTSITATGVPAGGSGNALKIVRTGGQVWAGAKVSGLSIPLSSTTTTITARVHSAVAGVPFVLKLEGPGASAEVRPTTAVVAGWQTLTWVFTGGDLKTWSDIVFLPNLGTVASASPGETYYVDDIMLLGTGGGGGAGTPSSLIYASNYSESPTPWKSVEGGDAGRYLDESVGAQDWWSGVATADTTPSFYFGYGFNINAKPWGFGAFVKAPGNSTAAVSAYANVKISVWGNDQLVNTHPNFAVILKTPPIGGCTPTVKGNIAVVAAGVQTYTLPLSGFTLQDACGLTTATQALATGVTEVHVQVLGSNVQFTSGGDAGGFYPNGLNIGPISFIN